MTIKWDKSVSMVLCLLSVSSFDFLHVTLKLMKIHSGYSRGYKTRFMLHNLHCSKHQVGY